MLSDVRECRLVNECWSTYFAREVSIYRVRAMLVFLEDEKKRGQ